MENSVEVSPKIKNRTAMWSSNSTSGYMSKGNENRISKRYMQPHVYCSIIHSSHHRETTEVSINGWIKKICMYTYNGILFNHNKEVSSAIYNNMYEPLDLEAVMLSIKVRQRKTNTVWYHWYVGSKKAELVPEAGGGGREIGAVLFKGTNLELVDK